MDARARCNALFVENFAQYDYVVSPSGSCVLHLKEHLHDVKHEPEATRIRSRIYELTEFLTDVSLRMTRFFGDPTQEPFWRAKIRKGSWIAWPAGG